MSELLDSEGYPTDEALQKISNYPIKSNEDVLALLALVKEIWWMPDWGWTEKRKYRGKINFHISTGGWSGNESLIYAMKDNLRFWAFHWKQSRAGGHYIFEVKV